MPQPPPGPLIYKAQRPFLARISLVLLGLFLAFTPLVTSLATSQTLSASLLLPRSDGNSTTSTNSTNSTETNNSTTNSTDSTDSETEETELWEKFTGFGLAVGSSIAIGTSFILAKKGLLASKSSVEGSSYKYLKSPIWWSGQVCMVLGEALNFAAYSFAPAILVTPLGALSVLIGAILAAYFLKEKLNFFAKIGCGLCILGSIDVVLHAPPEREIADVDTLVSIGANPGFITYLVIVVLFSIGMIWKVAPKYGRKNPLVYISICSSVGSISVMAVKAFGIALKLTFEGKSQLGKVSTYIFVIIVVAAALTQINYFNKALAIFSTSVVTPIYYVMFTTLTIIASVLLLQGISGASAADIVTALVGFIVIFLGVLLLHPPRYFVKDLLIQSRSNSIASTADAAAACAAASAAHGQLHPEDFGPMDSHIALEPIMDSNTDESSSRRFSHLHRVSYNDAKFAPSRISGNAKSTSNSSLGNGALNGHATIGSSVAGGIIPSSQSEDIDMGSRRLAVSQDLSSDSASERTYGREEEDVDDDENLGLVQHSRNGKHSGRGTFNLRM